MTENEGPARLAIVRAIAPRCPACGSSRRERFRGMRSYSISGQITGKPFNRIVQRWTSCRDCGRRYVIREHLFEPIPENPENRPPGGH